MPNTSPFELLYMLFALALVIALAYFVSKWLSKRGGVQTANIAKQFKVIDKLILGQDRAVYIVSVGGKNILLGVTQHHIENLGEVEIDEQQLAQTPTSTGFSDILKSTLKNNWGIGQGKNKGGKPSGGEENQHLDDV